MAFIEKGQLVLKLKVLFILPIFMCTFPSFPTDNVMGLFAPVPRSNSGKIS